MAYTKCVNCERRNTCPDSKATMRKENSSKISEIIRNPSRLDKMSYTDLSAIEDDVPRENIKKTGTTRGVTLADVKSMDTCELYKALGSN